MTNLTNAMTYRQLLDALKKSGPKEHWLDEPIWLKLRFEQQVFTAYAFDDQEEGIIIEKAATLDDIDSLGPPIEDATIVELKPKN
jgi:hypothetical protein